MMMMPLARPDDPVSRLVRRGPVTVVPHATLREVAAVLLREEVGVALVTREGSPVGLVSERDVTRALAEGADADDDRVEDVMAFEVVRVEPGATAATAARQMLDGEIRHLLVADGSRTLGVISMRDLLAACLQG